VYLKYTKSRQVAFNKQVNRITLIQSVTGEQKA